MYKIGAVLIAIAVALASYLIIHNKELVSYTIIAISWLVVCHFIFYRLRVYSFQTSIHCTCKAPYRHNNSAKISIELSKAQSFMKSFRERTRARVDLSHLIIKAIPTAFSKVYQERVNSNSPQECPNFIHFPDTVSLLVNIRNNLDQIITLRSLKSRVFENIVQEYNTKEVDFIMNMKSCTPDKVWDRKISINFLKSWFIDLCYTVSTLFWCNCGRLIPVSEINPDMPGSAIIMNLDSLPISEVKPSLPIFNFAPLVILIGNKIKSKQERVGSEIHDRIYTNIYATCDNRILNIWELTDFLTNLRDLLQNPRSYLTEISF